MAFGRGSSPITGSTIVSAGAIKNHPAMPESAIVAATPPPNEYAMRYRGASSTISSASRVSATAQMSKRLAWAEVVAVGANVRAMEPGDHVLFNPEDRYEVEVRGDDYVILRERDVHAVASKRLEEGSTGLYL